MQLLVKVRVKAATLREFGQKLQAGELDRSCIRSETWCVKADPAVGYSVWEAADRGEFDRIFKAWQTYYDTAEVTEVISPQEAMQALFAMQK